MVQYLAFVALAFGIAWTTIDINRPVSKVLVAARRWRRCSPCRCWSSLFGVYFSPVLPAAAVDHGVRGRRSFTPTARPASASASWTPPSARACRCGQMRALVDGRAALDADGQLEELTLVVCEIFNHQQLMDALEPADYAALMQPVSQRRRRKRSWKKAARWPRCDGEGVRVIFGAPLPLANHAVAACRAALEVARQFKTLNEETAREHDGLTCDIRVGVNSGEMAVGHFGSRRLGGFGVAGEEVAFARRLCAANLIYGSTVLIGARTFELAEAAIEARPLELLRRRLGDNWLEVYELLGEPHDLTPEALARRDLFWTGVIFYREKRLADALDKFSQARATTGQPDGPLDFYINRIKQLQHSKATTDWETARLLNSL